MPWSVPSRSCAGSTKARLASNRAPPRRGERGTLGASPDLISRQHHPESALSFQGGQRALSTRRQASKIQLRVSVMLLSCGDPVQPAAKADQRARSPKDVPDPVQQPAPAAQRPGVGQMADRLLHQRAQPCLQAVERPLLECQAVDGRAVPDRGMPVLARLGHAAEPPVQQATTSTSSSAPCSPASPSSSCSWPLPGQPPSTQSRSPWMVDSARPWAVWACRLASYRPFWLAHPLGRCTRVASPSTSTASPEVAI